MTKRRAARPGPKPTRSQQTAELSVLRQENAALRVEIVALHSLIAALGQMWQYATIDYIDPHTAEVVKKRLAALEVVGEE